MVVTDEDALICDFAETYGIYDYRSLPVLTAATLAQGLSGESRIMRRLSGVEYSSDTLILAGISDRLSQLVWMLSTFLGRKKSPPPQMVVDALLHGTKEKETAGFASGEEFMAAWRELTGG